MAGALASAMSKLIKMNPRSTLCLQQATDLSDQMRKNLEDTVALSCNRLHATLHRDLLIFQNPNSPTAICDYTGGMHLCQGILAALVRPNKTGLGRKVDVCLYDSMIHTQLQEAAYWSKYKQVLNWAAMPLAIHAEAKDGPIVMIGAFMPNPLQGYVRCIRNR